MAKALGNAVLGGQPGKEIFGRYEWIKFDTRNHHHQRLISFPWCVAGPTSCRRCGRGKCTSLRLEDLE